MGQLLNLNQQFNIYYQIREDKRLEKMTLHMKMILLSLVLLTVGFEVAYGGKLLKNLNKTKGQGGLERINGDSTKWVMRKVRKMMKAFNVLEEQLVSASADIASNSANIVSIDGDIVTLT